MRVMFLDINATRNESKQSNLEDKSRDLNDSGSSLHSRLYPPLYSLPFARTIYLSSRKDLHL